MAPLIFGIAKFVPAGQRLIANVSFAGTMWEHKGRLETQYCACSGADTRCVSNGLHQKISSTFCEEASSCPKRIRARARGKSTWNRFHKRDKAWKRRGCLTPLTLSARVLAGVRCRDGSSGIFFFSLKSARLMRLPAPV